MNPKTKYKHEPRIFPQNIEREVSFNPATRHWYDFWFPSNIDELPTKLGPVKIASLTEKKVVTEILDVNVENGFCPDIIIMRDESGYLGIFTNVKAADDTGHYNRTDRGGFGYKSIILYYNSQVGPLKGACHFMVTEYKTGEWGLFAICNRRDELASLTEYGEFLERKSLFKGYRSEAEVIQAFKDKFYYNLLDEERYTRYDLLAYK